MNKYGAKRRKTKTHTNEDGAKRRENKVFKRLDEHLRLNGGKSETGL